MSSLPEALADHLASHHGIVSRAEALGFGLSRSQISRRLARGDWVRVGRNVYRPAGVPPTWKAAARSAALELGGLVSHRAAAAVWGIDGFTERQIEVMVPHRRAMVRDDIVVHRSRQFARAAGCVVDGVPVTGLDRTVLDLAAVVSRRQFDRVVDAVLRQELLEWTDLYRVLVRHSIQGRNGCGPLRALLEERYGEKTVPDSAFNRMVGQLLVDAGVGHPRYEYVILHDGQFRGRVDLAYPDHRVAIECDSKRYHLNSDSFEADPRRKNGLLLAGWQVLTFTWADYRDRPAALVSTVRSALTAARNLG